MTRPPSVDPGASSGAPRKLETLRRDLAVLGGLRDDDAMRLLQAGRRFDSLPDEVVFDIGGGCDHVYLLLTGTVSLTATPRGRLDGAIELRRVGSGEAFGLEAAFGARARHARATCVGPCELIELPADLFARGVRRAGTRTTADLERAVRRQLTDERLRTLAFTGALPDPERALLLDMVRARRVDAGTTIYRDGQLADAMFLLVSGMVRLVSGHGESRRVRAYLSAGDFFGEHETLSSGTYRLAAEAMSACELLVVGRDDLRTLARRNPGLLESMQRIGFDRQQNQQAAFARTGHVRGAGEDDPTELGHTRHLFEDVYRASVATELLAIDLDRCVHCGTCAWSCHETHGQARLVRRGDKVLAPARNGGEPRRLLLPNSCQHCTDPACMVDCPTGAIGRDPDGEVFIHEATCIGCEACAKACPWDNIQIAPTAPGALHGQVAVKCDLCRGHDGVSACVSNCPTGAIVRLDPRQESAALRQVLGLAPLDDAAPSTEDASSRWTLPGLLAAAVLVFVAGVVGAARGALVPFAGAGLVAGFVALVGMFGLAAYGARKRTIGRQMRARRRKVEREGHAGRMPRLSAWYQAHLAVGAITLGAVMLHTGGRPGGPLTAALLAALLGATAFGATGVWLYRRLPPRLARLVARPGLPEDAAESARRLQRSMRDALGGRDHARQCADRVLAPALASRAMPWRLLFLSQDDRHTLRDRLLAAAGADTLDGADRHALDRASRYAVELLGLSAERLGQRLLAGWLLGHIVCSLVAVALMLVHAVHGVLLVWQW